MWQFYGGQIGLARGLDHPTDLHPGNPSWHWIIPMPCSHVRANIAKIQAFPFCNDRDMLEQV